MLLCFKTISQLAVVGLLICLAYIHAVSAQQKRNVDFRNLSQLEFDNGNYLKAIEFGESAAAIDKKSGNYHLLLNDLDLIASAQISLKKFEEAEITLNSGIAFIEKKPDARQEAIINLRFAWLLRSKREFSKSLEYSTKAHALEPKNLQVKGEHYLNVGRILFTSDKELSSIIWLKQAEISFESLPLSVAKLDTYRFLALASASRLDYRTALKYAGKFVQSTENSRFKYKYRQALFDFATTLSATGQTQKALETLKNGLRVSLSEDDWFHSCKFQSSLLLEALYVQDIPAAERYLNQLIKTDSNQQFTFEIKLGNAVLAAFKLQTETSKALFKELENQENSSEFILPYWKITIAERNHDWQQLVKINQELLALTKENNFVQDLPGIYLNFAKSFYHLNQRDKSIENAETSVAFIEQIRNSENKRLSIGLLETFHNAYRLLAQIKSNEVQSSFQLSDFLKARILKDRINDSVMRPEPELSAIIRSKLEALSLAFIEDENQNSEINDYEKQLVSNPPELNLDILDFGNLENISDLNNSAIVSYFFTFDQKLIAYVWEKGKSLKIVNLQISEDQADEYAETTQQKIKDLIFFKKDGKELYDKLLTPLSIASKHLIIIPDKSIWKIPFQALSPDGEKYLIEETRISYAPSVSVFLEQLNHPTPNRLTLQAFANSTYENKILKSVNAEAQSVAGIYGSLPVLNATVSDFRKSYQNADILHFAMHAQIDNDLPLNSFLGFRKIGMNDGRLTVEELMDFKLKKGSLAFIASCDTNKVLNGEGLVSLAWAMMGSGATTVISAQWEANDKSTEMFTKAFYKTYKQGSSSAEAIQKASLELINDKSSNMHEPYYWADFTLSGDFR